MQVQSLDQEDPLEKELATHSSILALEIPWTEEPGELQSTGSQRVRHNWETNTNLGDVAINSNQGGLYTCLFSFPKSLAKNKSKESKAKTCDGKGVTGSHWPSDPPSSQWRRWGMCSFPLGLALSGPETSDDLLFLAAKSQENQFSYFKGQCSWSNLWNEMLHKNKKWGSFWKGRKLGSDILENASFYFIKATHTYTQC